MFVFENVLGIQTANRGRTWRNLQAQMKRVGYHIECHEQNASSFGVLQSRSRMIIVGWRKGTAFGYPEFEAVNPHAVVNDLLQTSNPAVFAAGNVVIVYDLVDNVSDEGLIAGANAAKFAAGKISPNVRRIPVKGGENVRLYSPQFVTGEDDTIIYMRVTHPIEQACKVIAEPGLYTQRLRYARPGEMNEVRLKAADIKAKPDLKEITVDIRPM